MIEHGQQEGPQGPLSMETRTRVEIVRPGASCASDAEPFERIGRPRECLRCKDQLRGRQLRFCRSSHRTAFWHSLRGVTGIKAAPRSRQPLRFQILGLLSDGRWYTVMEIAAVLGVLPMTADRKLRDLRRPEYGGFLVSHRRRAGQRVSEFRVDIKAS